MILDDVYLDDRAVCTKCVLEIVFSRVIGKISHEQFSTHIILLGGMKDLQTLRNRSETFESSQKKPFADDCNNA